MSLKLFEQFLQTEITRNPGLVNSLKWKGGGLRRCSQLFDEAVADLHYRLVRRAIQLLFTRTNAARLRQLSVACEASCGSCSGGPAAGDGFVGSSCETKDPGSDSSRMTANSQHNINCSPGSRYTSQSVDVAFDNNETRWEGQSNNSQNFRQAPQRSPARQSGASLGCCRISAGNVCGNNSRWTTRAKDTKQQPAQQHLCPPQYPQQTQQSQQEQQQPPAVERKASCCSGPAPELLKPPTPPPPRRQPQPDVVEPPTEAAIVREGPAYNYPTANRHNRQTMAGWYVANMDALLSNLMRLFEKIYADTLRMCGASQDAMKDLRNALPDPTLLSMQQRAGGAWRPNYMNCKIDFLLHIAAMVYRNTQDLRCGCQCSVPADPCAAFTERPQFPQPQQQQQQQQQRQLSCQPQQLTLINQKCPGNTQNRNNAAAAPVTTADEFEDDIVGNSCSQPLGGSTMRSLPDDSSWEQGHDLLNRNRSNARSQAPYSQPELKSSAVVTAVDIQTSSSAVSSTSRIIKRASVMQKYRHHHPRRSCQKLSNNKKCRQPPAVLRSRTLVVSEDAISSEEKSSTTTGSGSSDDSDAAHSVRCRFSIDAS